MLLMLQVTLLLLWSSENDDSTQINVWARPESCSLSAVGTSRQISTQSHSLHHPQLRICNYSLSPKFLLLAYWFLRRKDSRSPKKLMLVSERRNRTSAPAPASRVGAQSPKVNVPAGLWAVPHMLVFVAKVLVARGLKICPEYTTFSNMNI